MAKTKWYSSFTGKKGGETREWIMAVSGFAALLLAIISFWTTARISGLEDYLRSEISRRNGDLQVLSTRSAEIEKLANERERQLAKLDSATSEILASSLLAQAQLSQSQSALGQVRADAFQALLKLQQTQNEQQRLQARFANQDAAFDLFKRQQTYGAFTLHIALQTAFLDSDDEENPNVSIGEQIIVALKSAKPDANQASLSPYFAVVAQNIERVCPRLKYRIMTLPPRVPRPDPPKITYLQGASKAEIERLTREAQQKYSDDFGKHISWRSDVLQAQLAGYGNVSKDTGQCVCSTLTTELISSDQICPQR